MNPSHVRGHVVYLNAVLGNVPLSEFSPQASSKLTCSLLPVDILCEWRMAHQAHNIPWTVLASTLKLKNSNRCQHDAENFHLRREPDRGKKLSYFANAFVRNALDHARCEREKYPKEYDPPNINDIVVTDDISSTIEATVHRWRLHDDVHNKFGPVQRPEQRTPCRHSKEDRTCRCALPLNERKMSAFLRKYESNTCYEFFKINKDAFFNLEVVKTLLLYGEMDTILRVCADPRVDLKTWWEKSKCQCEKADLGWDKICSLAMGAYIILNLLHCFPETWDDAGTPSDKYTSVKAYQHLVRRCTKSGWTSEIATYPHRQFFGIESGRFKTNPEPYDKARWGHILPGKYARLMYYPYGLMTYEEFLVFEQPACCQPHATDVSHMRWILCQKGLPTELSNFILETASYTAQRRLPVPGHPLHQANRVELEKYLKYCWQLLVRCTMLGQALGMDMELLLGNMVRKSVGRFFGCRCFKLLERTYDDGGREHLNFK